MTTHRLETQNTVALSAIATVLVGAAYAATHAEELGEATINTGKCIARCIAELGQRARIMCIATCTFNPSAY